MGACLQNKFEAFPWRDAPEDLEAWKQGQTGYPIVDAGMRELARTGFMHNRSRMIAASFLTKHLLIDWREGEKWFWECLAMQTRQTMWPVGNGRQVAALMPPLFPNFQPDYSGTEI